MEGSRTRGECDILGVDSKFPEVIVDDHESILRKNKNYDFDVEKTGAAAEDDRGRRTWTRMTHQQKQNS